MKRIIGYVFLALSVVLIITGLILNVKKYTEKKDNKKDILEDYKPDTDICVKENISFEVEKDKEEYIASYIKRLYTSNKYDEFFQVNNKKAEEYFAGYKIYNTINSIDISQMRKIESFTLGNVTYSGQTILGNTYMISGNIVREKYNEIYGEISSYNPLLLNDYNNNYNPSIYYSDIIDEYYYTLTGETQSKNNEIIKISKIEEDPANLTATFNIGTVMFDEVNSYCVYSKSQEFSTLINCYDQDKCNSIIENNDFINKENKKYFDEYKISFSKVGNNLVFKSIERTNAVNEKVKYSVNNHYKKGIQIDQTIEDTVNKVLSIYNQNGNYEYYQKKGNNLSKWYTGKIEATSLPFIEELIVYNSNDFERVYNVDELCEGTAVTLEKYRELYTKVLGSAASYKEPTKYIKDFEGTKVVFIPECSFNKDVKNKGYIFTYFDKVEKSDTNIVLYERVGLLDGISLYSDFDKTNLVSKNTNIYEAKELYNNKLMQFKYIFTNENGNYYLNSIEKVN